MLNKKTMSNLEKARIQHRFTQEEIAQAIGASRPGYVNIESGKKDLTVRQVKLSECSFHSMQI